MIAGAAIGAGMIALPMTLAKLGFIGTCALMAITWLIVYYSALLGTELTLRLNENLSLNEIAKRLSGWGAECIAIGCIMTLSYALLAAYLYGGSSILHSLMIAGLEQDIPIPFLTRCSAIFLIVILTLGIRWIDYINRLMFFGLIGLLTATIIGLMHDIQLTTIPNIIEQTFIPTTWTTAIPIIFTSFGFQMMIPAISGYLNQEAKPIKDAFFWGSLIPVCVYLAWTLSTLGTLTTLRPDFFDKIASKEIDVGQFVQMLSTATTWGQLQLLVWGVSIFAIITSAFGVALGLVDVWHKLLPVNMNSKVRNLTGALATISPPFIIALWVPGAFIKALGFAGMILAVIAIILPTYLIYKSDAKNQTATYSLIKNHYIRLICLAFAIGLIGCELFNMFSS